MAELTTGGTQETAVTRNPHEHLRDAQGHHLRIAEAPARVARTVGQEVVGCAVDTDQEQVEVGVHRGLLVDDVQDTADFDLPLHAPIATAVAVASII
jgi:hypothetical protein